MDQKSQLPAFFRIKNIVFSVFFILILTLPAFIKFPPPSDFESQAGKFLTSHPVLKKYWEIIQLPGKYQDYFSTHFFLRNNAVSWNNEILSRIGNKVFTNVLVGTQDWLFLTDENNLRYYQCDQPFTEEELERIVKKVQSMRDISLQNGAAFSLIISPNKESIYPEYLPSEIGISGKACRMDQVLQVLHSAGIDVLDLRKTLKEAKTTGQLYYRTDTHWNDTGAFLVYKTIISSLIDRFPKMRIWDQSDFKTEVQITKGDLSHLVPLEDPYSEISNVFSPINPRKAKISQGDDSKTIISETGNPANPKAVVFRDSFFMGLLPFFAENFSRGVYRWSFDFDQNLIESEKPDLVIYELAERYLDTLAR